MQKQLFIGNLTKDCIVKSIKKNEKEYTVATLSIAVNDYKNKDAEALFVDIQVWGKLAEVCAANLKKGDGVYVTTTMRRNNYSVEGKDIRGFDFIADEIEFLSRKKVSE